MKLINDKRGSYLGMFILMIVAVIILFVSAIFIYIGNETEDKLHETMDDMDIFGDANASEVIDNTFGKVNQSYSYLTWITVMLIFGMIMSIFIGSYKVRTEPVYFVPYTIISLICIIVSVGIANAYEEVIAKPTLAGTFALFTGGNFFMLHLPTFMTVIAFIGGIIIYISWTTKEDYRYG